MSSRAVFINKNVYSQNPARSTPEERRIINEQNRSRRTRVSSKPKAKRIDKEVIKLRRSAKKGSQDVTPPITSQSSSSREAEVSLANDGGQEMLLTLTRSELHTRQMTSIPSNPTLRTLDPFNTMPVPINTEMAELLQYYTFNVYESLWANAAASLTFDLDRRKMEICGPGEVISECVINRARMYTLLANISCHMQYLDGMILPGGSLRYVQQGVSLYSQEFGARGWVVDKEMLLHSFHLCAAAFASQQIDTIRVHLKGFQALMNRLDANTAQLAPSTVALVTNIDVNAPDKLLPFLSSDDRAKWLEQSQQASQSVQDNIYGDHVDVESRFSSSQYRPVVTSAILKLIGRCDKFIKIFDSALGQQSQKDVTIVMRQTSFHNRSLRQQIVLTEVVDCRSKCLLHALLLWTWVTDHLGMKLAEGAASHINKQLEHISIELWDDHLDILLWLSLTSALAAKDNSDAQRCLLDRVLHLSQRIEITRTYDLMEELEPKLAEFMEQYLWIDSVQQPRLHTVFSSTLWSSLLIAQIR